MAEKEQKLLKNKYFIRKDIKYIIENYGPIKATVAWGKVEWDKDADDDSNYIDVTYTEKINLILDALKDFGEGYSKKKVFTQYSDDADSDSFGGEHVVIILKVSDTRWSNMCSNTKIVS